MGLAARLDYKHRPAGLVAGLVRRLASTRAGALVFSKTLHHLDRAVMRLSRGRWSASGLFGRLPVLTVTSMGAKTGLSRETVLLGVPWHGDLAVVGTGWGQRRTPSWVANLRSHPRCTVTYRRTTVAAVANELPPDEAEAVMRSATGVYPGYAAYPVRASHRRIAVFVLSLDDS